MKSKIANVLDTEWTCYEDGFPTGESPEIIEVGITEVDLESLTIIRTLSIAVKPVKSKVSPYCTALTGWTEAALKRQGVPLSEACRRVAQKYGGVNRLLVTDCGSEAPSMKAECELANVEFPFGEEQLNVSVLFALVTGNRKRLSLTDMLNAVGLEFEGVLHRAGDDSKNIARLFIKLTEMSRQAK